MSSWYYREMGSRNKKTGKLNYYNVRVTEHKIDDCDIGMAKLEMQGAKGNCTAAGSQQLEIGK